MARTTPRDPSDEWHEITPSDTTDLPNGAARAIYVGGDGNINITDCKGNTEIFYGAKAGSIYQLQATRVLSTNTTATHLIALY